MTLFVKGAEAVVDTVNALKVSSVSDPVTVKKVASNDLGSKKSRFHHTIH